jgi:hypothetical protein
MEDEQQPCSNPSKSPEILGNASTQKYNDLQLFCKRQKRLAKCRATFTRQRRPFLLRRNVTRNRLGEAVGVTYKRRE